MSKQKIKLLTKINKNYIFYFVKKINIEFLIKKKVLNFIAKQY